MSNRKELGISSQDYEDAVNLEKIYSLISANPKCSECRKRKTSYIDLKHTKLLCENCGRNREDCKPVGSERLSNSDIKKFENRYKRGGSPSKGYIKEPKQDRGVRFRRPPSETPSYTSESESYYEPPISTKRNPPHRHHPPPHPKYENGDLFGDTPSIPGMRNILIGATGSPASQPSPYLHQPPPQYNSPYPPHFGSNFQPGMYQSPYGMSTNQSHSMQPNITSPSNLPGYPMMLPNNPSQTGMYGTQFHPTFTSQPPIPTNIGPYTNYQQNPSNYAFKPPNPQLTNYPTSSPFITGRSPSPFLAAHYPNPTNINLSHNPSPPHKVHSPVPFHTPNTSSRNPFAPQNIYPAPSRLTTPGQQQLDRSTINNNPFSMY